MPLSHETHARKSFRLIALGGASLVSPEGKPAAEQRRRLALLVLLAASGSRGTSRDKLIATLSPDSRTESARHALHQLLYYLRRQVGERAFIGTDPLRLDPAIVEYDVAEFEAAVARGALEEAATLYRGPFLDGFHLNESAVFDEWASAERTRLAATHVELLVRLAEGAVGRNDHGAAARWWRTLTAVEPLNARWSIGLMRALGANGDRGGALRHGQQYQESLREELDAEPDPSVAAVLRELRAPHRAITAPLPPPLVAPAQPSAEPSAEEALTVPTEVPAAVPTPVVPVRRRFRYVGAIGAVALAACAALVATRRVSPARDAPSLGVMAIVNSAGDSLDYLADGIARSALERLGGRRGIRVVTLRDVRRRGAPAEDVAALGRRMGVNAILSGALHRERDSLWLRVDVQRSRDGGRLASGRFVVEPMRLAALEADLLDTIAVALGLAPLERDDRRPRDAASTALLMRAEYHFGKRDEASFRRALELYLQAIDRDPASARAYAGLGSVYGAMGMYGLMPVSVAFERLRAAANRALSLDPQEAQAIAILAHERGFRSWEWVEAERGLRDAVRLEPWRAEHWMLLGTLLRVVGRFDESLAAYRKARALDPLARHYTYQIAHAFQCAGEPDSALAALRDAMTLGTSYPHAHASAANVMAGVGRYDDALEEWRVAAAQSGDSLRARLLQSARGRDGVERFLTQSARHELAVRDARPAGAGVSPTEYSSLYATLGDSAKALDWLERARDARDPNLPMIGCHAEYDFFRTSPRFMALLRSLHLTPATFGRRGGATAIASRSAAPAPSAR